MVISNKYFKIILFFSFAVLTSCNKSNEKKVDDFNNNLTKESKSETNNLGSLSDNSSGISSINDLNLSGKTLKTEKLSTFLPNIPGAESSPTSTGTSISDNDEEISVASMNYNFKKGSVNISIQDFGKTENIPKADLDYFNHPPILKGSTNEILTTPEGKGYSMVLESSPNTGKLYFLVGKRFIIKIDAYEIPPQIGGLPNLLKYIKIIKLINETK